MFRNLSKNKWLLVWVIIGFFLIMFDHEVYMGGINPYGAYETDGGYSLEFQVYTLNYAYGAECDINDIFTGDVRFNLTIDIFSDVVGFIILALFFKKMTGFSKLFGIASLMSWVAVVLYAVIHIMPFMINGMSLIYMAFWLSIAMYGIEVIIGYVFICAVSDTLSGFEHRQSRRAIAISWFGMIAVSAAVCVIRWIVLVSPILLMVYEIILMGVSLLFYYLVFREADFIVKDKVLGEN